LKSTKKGNIKKRVTHVLRDIDDTEKGTVKKLTIGLDDTGRLIGIKLMKGKNYTDRRAKRVTSRAQSHIG